MEETAKLRHLIEHWMEHNEDHVKNYREWAQKAEGWDRGELAAVLEEIAQENERMNELFRKALSLT